MMYQWYTNVNNYVSIVRVKFFCLFAKANWLLVTLFEILIGTYFLFHTQVAHSPNPLPNTPFLSRNNSFAKTSIALYKTADENHYKKGH